MKIYTLLTLLLVLAFLSSCSPSPQVVPTFATPIRTNTVPAPTWTAAPTSVPIQIPTETPIPLNVDDTLPVLIPVNAAPKGEFDALSPQNAIWADRVGVLWDRVSGVGSVALINAPLENSSLANSFYFSYSSVGSTSLGIWQAGRSQQIFSLEDRPVPVTGLLASPDGQWLAVMTLDGMFLGSVTGDSAGLQFTPQDLPLDELIDSSSATGGLQAAFSPDNRLLAVANSEDKILLWDLQNNSELGLVEGGVVGATSCRSNYRGLAFTSEGQSLLYACQAYLLGLDLSTLQSTLLFRLNAAPGWFALSPSGNFLAHMAANDTSLTLRKFPSGSIQSRLNGFTVLAQNMVFSPDETLLVTSNGDETFSLWDLKTGKRLTSLQADYVTGFTAGSTFLMSADGSLWGVKAGLSEVPRRGLRVLHVQTEPATNGFHLQGWEDAIPAEWLAQEGAAPRYEVRLSRIYRQVEDCVYIPEAHVYRRQIGVFVKVSDLQTGSIVGSFKFWGGLPPRCENSHSFPETITVEYYDGTDPEIEPYITWLDKMLRP